MAELGDDLSKAWEKVHVAMFDLEAQTKALGAACDDQAKSLRNLTAQMKGMSTIGERLLGRFLAILPSLTDQDVRLVRQMRVLLAWIEHALARVAVGTRKGKS